MVNHNYLLFTFLVRAAGLEPATGKFRVSSLYH